MTVVVFGGPTIGREEVLQEIPAAICQGPAACGDVYLACKQNPSSILIIDGYFDHRLSVWHKEILWALGSGTRVYGAASMGALRAAELDQFGMIGVGAIYEMFRRGELEDDDEVAILHEPMERGYTTRSDAMVNIRATLRKAVAEHGLDAEGAAELERMAKSLYYAERSLAAIADEWSTKQRPAGVRFRDWLSRNGVVDLKKSDALSLIRVVAEHETDPRSAPQQHAFRMENTHYWQLLQQTLDASSGSNADEAAGSGGAARGASPASGIHTPQRMIAAERALALAIGEGGGAVVTEADAQRTSEQFRRRQELLSPDATTDWLRRHGLSLAEFSKLAHEQVLVERFGRAASAAIQEQLASVTLGWSNSELHDP